jgi:hypothetical protein
MTTCPANLALDLIKKDDVFGDILTEQDLLNLNDPTAKLDQTLLLGTTAAINAKLDEQKTKKIPSAYPYDEFKDQFPTLSERISNGPISPAEVAIFVTQTGARLQDPISGLNDGADTGADNTGQDGNAQFTDTDQLSVDYSDWVPGAPPPVGVEQSLEQLDAFFDENIGKSLSGGACAAYAAVGLAIGDLLKKMAEKAESLNSLPSLDLKNFSLKEILSGFAVKIKLQLELVGSIIKKTIDKLVKKAKKVAKSVAKAVDKGIADFKNAGKSIEGLITKSQKKVKDLVSKANIKNLKDGIDKMVAGAASMFEKLTPAVLGLLMFRFCQVTEAVQGMMDKPLKNLQNVADKIKQVQQSIKSKSQQHTKTAVEAGATRMDPDQVEEKKEEVIKVQWARSVTVDRLADELIEIYEKPEGFANDFQWAGIDDRYPPANRPRIGTNQRKDLDSFKNDDDNLGYEVGSTKIMVVDNENMGTTLRKDGKDTGEPGPAWQEVKPDLFVKLMDMAHQLGLAGIEPVEMIRGFRYDIPEDDIKKGVDARKFSKGRGITVKTPTDNKGRMMYFIAASRAGFKGIAVDTDVMHLTMGNRSGIVVNDMLKEFGKVNTAFEAGDVEMGTAETIPVQLVGDALRKHLNGIWGNITFAETPPPPEENQKSEEDKELEDQPEVETASTEPPPPDIKVGGMNVPHDFPAEQVKFENDSEELMSYERDSVSGNILNYTVKGVDEEGFSYTNTVSTDYAMQLRESGV